MVELRFLGEEEVKVGGVLLTISWIVLKLVPAWTTGIAVLASYENILGDTAATFNSSNAQTFRPQAGMDVANGTLPPGEVDMSQIAGLMSSK